MIKHKPVIEELLKKAKDADERLYHKLNLVAIYDHLGVDMYLLPDKEDKNSGRLFLDQFKFDIPNRELCSFNGDEISFSIDPKDYNTIWYCLFNHIKFADSLVNLKTNEVFYKITKRWVVGSSISLFEIDDDEHIMRVGKFEMNGTDLAFCPTEWGWNYDEKTKTFYTNIPEIIVEGGVKSYQERIEYIAQKIDILEDYFMGLHLYYAEC